MSETKPFHIAEIISLTADKMVARSHLDGLHALLEFMCGGPVYTTQMPRAMRACAADLLKQFPMLAGEKAEDVNEKNLDQWIARMEAKYGKMLNVASLPEGAYQSVDPVTEIERIRNPVTH